MMDEDSWNNPYKKLQAVEDQIEEGSLMQSYVDLYRKKFRGEPLIDVNKVSIAQVKHLKSVAKDKAHALLHHYFEMRDDWFVKQAYSLDCLIKNLNKVNASYSQRTTNHKDSGKIQVQFSCDSCSREFTLVCDMHYNLVNKRTRCIDCERDDKPGKVVTKEKKYAAARTGTIFPEMPSGLDSPNIDD